MNPATPQPPRKELEASLTALLLGELSAEKAAALHEVMAKDSELARLYERLKLAIELVRETAASPVEQTQPEAAPLKLSDSRRQKLLQHFKTVAPREFAEPKKRGRKWVLEIAAAAAVVIVLGMSLTFFSQSFKLESRISQWRLFEGGPVNTMTENSAAPLAADAALEKSKAEAIAKRVPGATLTTTVAIPASPATPAGQSIILPTDGAVDFSYQTRPLVVTASAGNSGESLYSSDPSLSGTLSPNGSQAATEPLLRQRGVDSKDGAAVARSSGKGIILPALQRVLRNGTADWPAQRAPASHDFETFAVENSGAIHSPTNRATSRYADSVPAFEKDSIDGYSPDLPAPAAPSPSLPMESAAAPNLELATGLPEPISAPALAPEVASAPAPRATIAARKSAPSDERKALGVEWYAGNSVITTNGVTMQAGTAVADLGEFKTGTTKDDVALGINEHLAWDDSADKVPSLGDLPVEGRLFRSELGRQAGQKSEAPQAAAMEPKQVITGTAQLGVYPGSRVVAEDQLLTSGGKLTLNGRNSDGDKTVVGAGAFEVTNQVAALDGWSFSTSALPNVGWVGRIHRGTPWQTTTQSALKDANGDEVLNQDGAVFLGLTTNYSSKAGYEVAGVDRSTLAILPSKPEEEVNLQRRSGRGAIKLADSSTATTLAGTEPRIEKAAKEAESLKQNGRGESAQAPETLPAGSINLEQADLNQVLELYGKLTGRQVLRSGNLPAAKITLKTQEPLSKREAIQALDASLALNGMTAINFGDHFVKAEAVATANSAAARLEGKDAARLADPASKYPTHIFQLKSAKPSEVAQALRPIAGVPNSILPVDESRILVLRDSPENVSRMLREIAKIDTIKGKADSEPEPKPRPSTNAPIPQPEVQTCDNAFSTFSLNVSDVSFKLAAASLEKGVMPDAANVRSEEFINAFDYRDPEAPPGVPVAFAWERARNPFAQLREIVRFSLKTAATGRQSGRPFNLVLLLDNSGSMERADRVQIIHEALRLLASQLKAEDKLSVITFARTPHLWVDGVSGSQAGQVAEEVSGLTPQGGTNLEDAMNLAYQTALRHYLANGMNRVVLLTDGAANLGNVEPEALKQKVEINRKQGVALDCFGIGWEGFNDDLLEVLSRNGDGRYGFINTPEEATTEFAAQLAGALHVAASDVKVQVEFNPKRVTTYRQIGYAKHQLTKEQFRDNTVDAAELAAQEAGNALYVVEVNAGGEGPLGTVRVRYKVPGTTDYHEHEWPVPYTGSAVSLEQSSPAMRLAATASAFSEWLVSSPYAAEVTPDQLLGYLSGVPEMYGADGRPKKLEWMIRQAKSLAGK